jgi:general stress protein 26
MIEPVVMRPYMPGYDVPGDTDGVLPWSWANERLARSRNYWFVTASAAGRPHAMPVWGVWSSEHGVWWTSCGPESRKARNLVVNPQCTVAVDDTCECVSLEGRAAAIVDPVRVDAAIAAYVAKYAAEVGGDPDEFAGFIRSNALFEVTPDRAFGIIERPDEFSARATKWQF